MKCLFLIILFNTTPVSPVGLLAALATLANSNSGGNSCPSPSGNSSGNGSSAAGTFPSLYFRAEAIYIVCSLFIIRMASLLFSFISSHVCMLLFLFRFSQFMAYSVHGLWNCFIQMFPLGFPSRLFWHFKWMWHSLIVHNCYGNSSHQNSCIKFPGVNNTTKMNILVIWKLSVLRVPLRSLEK